MTTSRRISLSKLQALEEHAFAKLFPFASDEEIEGIATRMAEQGFREDRPIILYDGKILDGRNRRKALARAVRIKGTPISGWCRVYDGPLDPLEFVLSENLDRRHLSESQRAIVAANLANWSRGMSKPGQESAHVHTRDEVAKILNVSKRSISYAKQIIGRSDALAMAVSEGKLKVRTAAELIELGDKELVKVLAGEQNAIIAKSTEIRTARKLITREMRTAKINEIAAQGSGQIPDLPRNQYPIIYCDWPWENEGVRDFLTGHDKSPPYPTLPVEDALALCEGDKSPALEDAAIFFWVTNNRLDDGIDVIRHWGFDYVTSYAWGKEGETEGMGMGFWVRDCHEVLLIGKRGKMLPPDQTTLERSLHYLRKKKHSEKPELFARIIDKQWPDLPKLELFQRKQSLVEGDIRLHKREKGRWSFWGFEAGAERGKAGGAV